MNDPSKPQRRGHRKWLFGCLLGCALIVVAPLCVLVVWVMLYAYPDTWTSSEDEARKVSGFSAEVSDPASYWGKYSIVVNVESSRFDAIMVNAIPDGLIGMVGVGMRGGKTVFYYIEPAAVDTMVIDGKTYGWQDREDLPLSEEQLRKVAANLTETEIADLSELARLLNDDTIRKQIAERAGHQRRIEFWTMGAIGRFEQESARIIEMRQRIVREEAAGTSPTKQPR